MDFTVEVSNEIYPKQVILEAKSAFANYADFVVVPIRVGVVSLTIKPFEKYEASSREIALSFLNYALGKLFKNPCYQAGWNKNVPFSFS